VFRYPGKYFQPYLGAGLGVFHARKHDAETGDTQYSLRHGFNAQAGVRIKATEHVAVFAEWKFNYTRFHFDQTQHLSGSNAKYNVHHFVMGLGYHF
jgi:opacity protein-like surface antigen